MGKRGNIAAKRDLTLACYRAPPVGTVLKPYSFSDLWTLARWRFPISPMLQGYLTDLLVRKEFPPYRGTCIDLEALAEALSVDVTALRAAKMHLRPIFDAVAKDG